MFIFNWLIAQNPNTSGFSDARGVKIDSYAFKISAVMAHFSLPDRVFCVCEFYKSNDNTKEIETFS